MADKKNKLERDIDKITDRFIAAALKARTNPRLLTEDDKQLLARYGPNVVERLKAKRHSLEKIKEKAVTAAKTFVNMNPAVQDTSLHSYSAWLDSLLEQLK